jgi:hypothetical protein
MPRSPKGRLLTFGLGCLVSGCAISQQTPASTSRALTADEMLTIQSRIIDCEWKAADQYDDGKRTTSELARQVMGVCSVERTKAELAFGVLNDPEIETIEFEQAVNAIEGARKSRKNAGLPPSR